MFVYILQGLILQEAIKYIGNLEKKIQGMARE